MARPVQRGCQPASFRFPRAYTSQLRVEHLEDRGLPSGLYYWADGQKIELTVAVEEFAVRVPGPNAEAQIAQLTADGGLFAAYQVRESVLPGVFRLELEGGTWTPPVPGGPGLSWAT